MSSKEMKELTKPINLFYPGYEGSAAYRIPSMITTTKGTVIAGIDARIVDTRDNPNEIETFIRRSKDNGETWDEVQKLVAYPGEGLDGAAAIDTALLQNEETETIWLLVCHTPGGIGLWNSDTGVGFDQDGNRILYDKDKNAYTLKESGEVYDSEGQKTAYIVDENGSVFESGEEKGNIYFKDGVDPNQSLLEARTSFLQVIKSEDDGEIWSDPIELNPQVKEEWMAFIGAGPGRGVQLKHGEKKGRIAFPIYFSNKYRKMSCAVIYSDDDGKTWERGESPNDGRTFNGETLNAENLATDNADLTESQLVEMPNGELHVYMRNHSGKQRTAFAISKDGGETWSDVTYKDELIDPTCQSTILKYSDSSDEKTRLIFVNPSHEHSREDGVIRLSEDGGKTWPYQKPVNKGSFIYSCLTELENGEIGLSYESGNDEGYEIEIKFVKFSIDWLKS